MVDLLALFSVIVFVIVGLPTFLLVVGRIIAIFTGMGATTSEIQKPEGEQKGKALVVYEPGATGMTKKAATEFADVLLGRGYEVTLAGIKSSAANDTARYNLLLLGTPSYLGRPTGMFKKYVKNLNLASNQVLGIFLTGTRGAPAVGFVPKAFLESMKKPLAEHSLQAKEMAFLGYGQYDYSELIDVLIATPAQAPELVIQNAPQDH